jgi:hypothetical protein
MPWLQKKRILIEKKWNQKSEGSVLMRRITATCNLSFPKSVASIEVALQPFYRSGGFLGFTNIEDPTKIILYLRPRQTYSALKSTLCHELIHCLCWSNTRFDRRRTATSYFADMFADETLTYILEAYVVKGKMTKRDYQRALDKARSEACTTLRNLKKSSDYGHFVDELQRFFGNYKREVRKGSNILRQRQRMLKDILSPNDS